MHGSAVLSLRNIAKNFGSDKGKLSILEDITLDFKQPHTYAITGVSGTGKSTLMHIIAGLEKPSSGFVAYNGHNLAEMNTHEQQYFLNNSVGLMFQQPYLIKELTVLENVAMPAILKGIPDSQAQEHAQILLRQVGIADKAHSKPATLSGGQQQRAALARALCNKPSFLLADEPTGNLDIQTGRTIIDLLVTLQKEWKMGIIISTHDPYVAQKMEYRFELINGMLKPA